MSFPSRKREGIEGRACAPSRVTSDSPSPGPSREREGRD
jgi:hypothetical protein